MKTYFVLAALAVGAISSAQIVGNEQEIDGTSMLHQAWNVSNDQIGQGAPRSNGPEAVSYAYNNTTTSTGFFLGNGGATASPFQTKYVTDLVNFSASGFGGQNVTKWQWSVVNPNATAVSARMRIRMHQDNGGVPGTYITGFTFALTSFAANSSSAWFISPTAGQVVLPTNGKVWVGICFDLTGSTNTMAEVNNLGQLLYNAPTVGSSADSIFVTTAASVGNVNNPAGSNINFGGAPVANEYLMLEAVPEPATMAVLGLGILPLLRRRRKA